MNTKAIGQVGADILRLTVCPHGVDQTVRLCALCEQRREFKEQELAATRALFAPVPDPARYLDLDSEDAVERWERATARAVHDRIHARSTEAGCDGCKTLARDLLAALRNPTADEG